MTEEMTQEAFSMDIFEIMNMLPHRYASSQIPVPSRRQNYRMCSGKILQGLQKSDYE